MSWAPFGWSRCLCMTRIVISFVVRVRSWLAWIFQDGPQGGGLNKCWSLTPVMRIAPNTGTIPNMFYFLKKGHAGTLFSPLQECCKFCPVALTEVNHCTLWSPMIMRDLLYHCFGLPQATDREQHLGSPPRRAPIQREIIAKNYPYQFSGPMTWANMCDWRCVATFQASRIFQVCSPGVFYSCAKPSGDENCMNFLRLRLLSRLSIKHSWNMLKPASRVCWSWTLSAILWFLNQCAWLELI